MQRSNESRDTTSLIQQLEERKGISDALYFFLLISFSKAMRIWEPNSFQINFLQCIHTLEKETILNILRISLISFNNPHWFLIYRSIKYYKSNGRFIVTIGKKIYMNGKGKTTLIKAKNVLLSSLVLQRKCSF